MAENFRLYAADFVNIMNSLEPVLTDVISTDYRFSNPFKWFTHDNYLYRIHISHLEGYSFHMSVHKTEDYGYLYFVISEWERVEIEPDVHRLVTRDGLHYHSLYRITLEELEQIIEFAEGLERAQVIWSATPPPPKPPMPFAGTLTKLRDLFQRFF